MTKLSGRTIAALKREGITKPHQKTVGELLRVPGIGVKGVAEIAGRVYANQYAYRDEPWPEFAEPPEPEKRCSHRVKLSERCVRCIEDAGLRI